MADDVKSPDAPADVLPCPICRRPVPYGGESFPFCTPRCKLIDLGRWLDGRYQVPVRSTPADADDAT